MTQKEAADALKISVVTLSRYENGEHEPRIGDLVKLAEIYKISLGELLCLEETHPQKESEPPKTVSTPIDIEDDDVLSLLGPLADKLKKYYPRMTDSKQLIVKELLHECMRSVYGHSWCEEAKLNSSVG